MQLCAMSCMSCFLLKRSSIPSKQRSSWNMLHLHLNNCCLSKLKTCWLNIVQLHLARDLWNKYHIISTFFSYEDMPLSVVLFHFQSKFQKCEDVKPNKVEKATSSQCFMRFDRFQGWHPAATMAYLQENVTPQSKDYFHTHRIHGTGIFTYILLIFMVNVGKYTIHGSYGIQWAICWNSCVSTFISCFVFFVKSSISSSFRWSSCKMCLYPLEPGPSSCTMHHNFICPSVTKNWLLYWASHRCPASRMATNLEKNTTKTRQHSAKGCARNAVSVCRLLWLHHVEVENMLTEHCRINRRFYAPSNRPVKQTPPYLNKNSFLWRHAVVCSPFPLPI